MRTRTLRVFVLQQEEPRRDLATFGDPLLLDETKWLANHITDA